MQEVARQARNAQRLAELHPAFAARVSAIIASLEADGYRRDPTHVEPTDVTVAEAREGKRPASLTSRTVRRARGKARSGPRSGNRTVPARGK